MLENGRLNNGSYGTPLHAPASRGAARLQRRRYAALRAAAAARNLIPPQHQTRASFAHSYSSRRVTVTRHPKQTETSFTPLCRATASMRAARRGLTTVTALLRHVRVARRADALLQTTRALRYMFRLLSLCHPARVNAEMMCEGGWDAFVPDYSWVSVVRRAPGCQAVSTCEGGPCVGAGGVHSTMGYDEFNITARAVSKGLIPPGTQGNKAKVGYGCWFYTAANATFWTGAAHVNVGRSLRGLTRCQINAFLYGTAKSGERAIGHCFANPGDKFWCTFARALGYDSIQVAHGGATYQAGKRKGRKRPLGELVDCTRPCMEELFTSDACVPVARAVASDGTVGPCSCAKGQRGLTCDGRNESYLWRCPGVIPMQPSRMEDVDVHGLRSRQAHPRPRDCRAKLSNLTIPRPEPTPRRL